MSLKQLLVIPLVLIFNACTQPSIKSGPQYPADGNRIFDTEDIISAKDSLILNKLFLEHQRKTSNQIALVTTESYGEHKDLAQFATFYFSALGVGRADLNNGIGIAYSNKLRSCYIATGYGTEKVMTDDIVKRIVDSLMIPRFKEDKLLEGLRDGSEALIEFLERPENRIE